MSRTHILQRRALIGVLLGVIALGAIWLFYITRDRSRVVETPLTSELDRVTNALQGDERFANVDVQVATDGGRMLMGGEVPDAASLAALRAMLEEMRLTSEIEWRVEVMR